MTARPLDMSEFSPLVLRRNVKRSNICSRDGVLKSGSSRSKLWWLLDIAAADEPARSEQWANLRKELRPRQLGGVVVEVGVVVVR
jgi:hypothetical protein